MTLDLHFANRLRYPPGPTGGIVVIRMKGMTVSTAYRRLLMILSSRLRSRSFPSMAGFDNILS